MGIVTPPYITRWLLLLGLWFRLISTTPLSSTTYCVSPTTALAAKLELTCHPLSYYLEDMAKYFTSNTEFVFLPGSHSLETGDLVRIEDKNEIVFTGNGSFILKSQNGQEWMESTSRITCGGTNHSGFAFVNITNLSFHNLTLESCGGILSRELADEVLLRQTSSLYKIGYGLKTALFLANVSSLTLDGVSIRDGMGYGILGINVLGESAITNSVFISNNWYSTGNNGYHGYQTPESVFESQGGNALIVYGDPLDCRKRTVKLYINRSLFAFGLDTTGCDMAFLNNSDYVSGGSGLGFKLAQTTYLLQLEISNTTCVGNVAYEGANLRIDVSLMAAKFSISVDDVISRNGAGIPMTKEGLLIYNGTGVGLMYQYGFSPPSAHCVAADNTTVQALSISNSTVRSNRGDKGVGMKLNLWPREQFVGESKVRITLRNCTITGNIGYGNGIGICITEVSRPNSMFNIVIQDSHITNNSFIIPISGDLLGGLFTTVTLISVRDISVINSNFCDNGISALYAFGTSITLAGDVNFTGNTGINGGAMVLDGASVFYLRNATSVYFSNNSALVSGGAIYVYTHVNDPFEHACFFQVAEDEFQSDVDENELSDFIQIRFRNNSANHSGTDIYGGAIDRCLLVSGPVFLGNSSAVFEMLFHFDSPPTDTSLISSSPSFVCLCQNNSPVCDMKYYNDASCYPGGKVFLPVVAVGQKHGVTGPAPVKLVFKDPQTVARLGSLDNPQDTKLACTHLDYTIYSPNRFESVYFEVEGAVSLENATIINVTLRDCPPGFQLSLSSFVCDCIPLLHKHHLECDITNVTIRRNSHVWLGVSKDKGITFGVLCPFDYCVSYKHKPYIHPADPNEQCAFERGGTLCGMCRNNLSLVLGSSRCLACSNKHLLLLLAFAGAGLALVLFLILCNLTVSVGAINGLIFHANILEVNHAVFFPDGKATFFSVFIAWLNLDLGIETCFYNGLNPYSKVWLQFVFPIYIWIIMGCIIFLSKYSITVTRLCGPNSVSVLATLFLLSFTKIESNVITVLQFGTLKIEGGHKETVWMYNGHVSYLTGGHIILFVVAVLFLISSITYAFLVFFSPWLLALSKPMCLTKYMKPVIDAYHGPYKDKHRYWTGLMLLVRGVLFITFSVTADVLAVNILVITISTFLIITLFWGVGGVYRNVWLNVLESSFLLNLGILSAATMYSELAYDQQKPEIIYTSVGIAFATFIGILAYHICQQARKRVLCVKTPSFIDLLLRFCVSRARDQDDIQTSTERLPILDYEQREPSSPMDRHSHFHAHTGTN